MTFETFPATRLRRLRTNQWIRTLIAENKLAVSDLVMPLFVFQNLPDVALSSKKTPQPLPFPPLSVDSLPDFVEEKILAVGLTSVALFPVIAQQNKDEQGRHALCEDNVLVKAIQCLKERFPTLGVISDIALDPYTTHGHDGVIQNDDVDNDATIKILADMAVLHAQAGADVLGVSDMMDGRIHALRQGLEEKGYVQTKILSYVAKYASCLYGPFRDIVATAAAKDPGGLCKKTYQMDICNQKEALREALLDIQEGADLLMVKPGGGYLDIVSLLKQKTHHPLCVFQVSGEYAMLRAADAQGWVSYKDGLLESLMGFKRAGASVIFTYGALDAARWLKEMDR